MKKIVSIVVAVLPVIVFAQQAKFIIKGKVGDLNAPAMVYLRYTNDGKSVTDSTGLNNGNFQFEGEVEAPLKASLSMNHVGSGRSNDGITLYLEKGTIKVESRDSLKNASVTGSRLNQDLQNLNIALKPVTEKLKALNAEYTALTPEQKQDKQYTEVIFRKSEASTAERRAIQKKYISENPETIVSLDALNNYGGNSPNLADVEPMFQSLSATVKNSRDGIAYASKLEKLKLTAIGAVAPDFTQNDPKGNPVSLSTFRGKYVLVDFWASWCRPCRAENPNVVKAYTAFKNKNFTVLGVSLDRPNARENWLKAIADDHLSWHHVSDLNYWKNAVAIQYGVQAIPQNFLVAPDGRIVAKNLRGEELSKKLEELIQ